jgi:cytochrome c oxidase subunit 4
MTEHHHPSASINDPEHQEQHIVSPGQYLLIWVTLLFFTGVTVGAATLELGVFNPVVAVAIACVKACIVILFFMHLKYSSKLVKFTCGAGFFTFLVLIFMCMTDYISRAWGQW